jgi:hypothetical protein
MADDSLEGRRLDGFTTDMPPSNSIPLTLNPCLHGRTTNGGCDSLNLLQKTAKAEPSYQNLKKQSFNLRNSLGKKNYYFVYNLFPLLIKLARKRKERRSRNEGCLLRNQQRSTLFNERGKMGKLWNYITDPFNPRRN